jgi:hypothetical protein
MQEPQNGADLVQYVAAVNWMRNAIPNYSKHVVPIQASLAKLFEGNSRRIKKAAAAVSLLHLWGPALPALHCPNICPTIFYYVRALDRCYQYTAL